MENLPDLLCPITYELLKDPIILPCCNRAISRDSIIQCLESNTSCPICRGDLSDFNAVLAPRNITLASLVESLGSEIIKNIHEWTSSIKKIPSSQICELTIAVKDSRFKVNPSLFILVVDNSGSMAGKAFDQVKTALIHIIGIAQHNKSMIIKIVTYNSTASLVNLTGNIDEDVKTVMRLQAGGGTNFLNAFHEVKDIIFTETKKNAKITIVSIAFLTDGVDFSGKSHQELVSIFKDILTTTTTGSLSVTTHTLGFGRDCATGLLENMRTCGTTHGTYRYAEPEENDDSLCQKITGVFQLCSDQNTVPITVKLPSGFTGFNDETMMDIQLPIDLKSWGSVQIWIKSSNETATSAEISVSSEYDRNVRVHPQISTVAKDSDIYEKLLSKMTDYVAEYILNIGMITHSDVVQQIKAKIIIKHLTDIISKSGKDSNARSRSEFLIQQVKEWLSGKQLSVNKLSDMRFSTLFTNQQKSTATTTMAGKQTPIVAVSTLPAVSNIAIFERHILHYNRSVSASASKNRNKLQTVICEQSLSHNISDQVLVELGNVTRDDILYQDIDGNNTLMLASYCGHYMIVQRVLDMIGLGSHPVFNMVNTAGESAMTLAIKTRGFYTTIKMLLDFGVQIPSDRKKALERYAYENKYGKTLNLLQSFSASQFDGSTTTEVLDKTMSNEYIMMIYARDKDIINGSPSSKLRYLDVALAKGMLDFIHELLNHCEPTVNMLFEYAFPPKPDHPETEKYLAIVRLLLAKQPEFIHMVDDKQDTLLHVATRKGSLLHVKYFISLGIAIDQSNEKGNSAFAVASYMQYPCIMTELINHGADVNRENSNGITPIYGVCERGSKKIAELLVSYGAQVDHISSGGDSPILACCRSGNDEVLKYLLEYVDNDFINRLAPFDGFNAIMACAESVKPLCISVLHEHGIDLTQRTREDNKIIAGATPLHISAYYGRTSALERFIELGCDVNIRDYLGATPLHIAVIQGFSETIKFLVQNGADIEARDRNGNTAISYCRQDATIRDLLVDPVNEVLMELATNMVTSEEMTSRISVFRDVKTSLKSLMFISPVVTSRELLIEASICSRREVVELLIDLGADANTCDANGLSPLFWATHNKATRIINILAPLTNQEIKNTVTQQLATLKSCTFPTYTPMTFLGITPPLQCIPDKMSTISQRMLINIHDMIQIHQQSTDDVVLPALTSQMTSLVSCLTKELEELRNSRLFWNAKVNVIKKIVGNHLVPLDPEQCLMISMYTNNALIATYLNPITTQSLWGLLKGSLLALPPYVGETFIGIANIDRSTLTVGKTLMWKHFASSSTIWRISMDNCTSYISKTRKGTILAIQSKTGRLVSHISQFTYDSEVIHLPYTKFTVTNWYHGSAIALGQANIRETSYKVKEIDGEMMSMSDMISSDKSLIIELTEI